MGTAWGIADHDPETDADCECELNALFVKERLKATVMYTGKWIL